MELVIWIGTALTLLGILGLAWCIVKVMRLKKQKLSDADIKAAMQRVVVLNMAALAVSAIGLMAVIIGVILA